MATNNVVSQLINKRHRLAEEKRKVQRECEIRVKEIDYEIGKINSAIEVIEKAMEPYLCPVCKGTGNTRRADAAGQMEDWECEACKGTGVKIN